MLLLKTNPAVEMDKQFADLGVAPNDEVRLVENYTSLPITEPPKKKPDQPLAFERSALHGLS